MAFAHAYSRRSSDNFVKKVLQNSHFDLLTKTHSGKTTKSQQKKFQVSKMYIWPELSPTLTASQLPSLAATCIGVRPLRVRKSSKAPPSTSVRMTSRGRASATAIVSGVSAHCQWNDKLLTSKFHFQHKTRQSARPDLARGCYNTALRPGEWR